MFKPSIILIFAATIFLPKHVESEPPTTPTYFIEVCRPAFGNFTLGSPYHTNLQAVLSELPNLASSNQSSVMSRGQGPDRVYGEYYCRGDIHVQLCMDCVKEAADSISSNCSNSKAAIMWYEECTLRYENQSMAGIEAEYPRSWWSSTRNVSDPKGFSSVVGETMDQLIKKTAGPGSNSFATEERRVLENVTLYSLAQCSPDLNGTQCETCLRSTVNFMPACCGNSSAWMFVFYPVCQLRYDTQQRFYALPPPPAASQVFT